MTRTQLTTLRPTIFPDIHKFTVGFDDFFRDLENRHQTLDTNYPPYNVIRETEEKFLVELAVAGFDKDEISITVEKQVLTVSGKQQEDTEGVDYIHRGISGRDFIRTWTLADYVEVVDATFNNGILSISLERKLPESQKPKTIAITKV